MNKFNTDCGCNLTPRGKKRGVKIQIAQDKSRSNLRGTNPKNDLTNVIKHNIKYYKQ